MLHFFLEETALRYDYFGVIGTVLERRAKLGDGHAPHLPVMVSIWDTVKPRGTIS